MLVQETQGKADRGLYSSATSSSMGEEWWSMHPTFYFTWELFLFYLTQKVNRIWHPLEVWKLLKTES